MDLIAIVEMLKKNPGYIYIPDEGDIAMLCLPDTQDVRAYVGDFKNLTDAEVNEKLVELVNK